MERRVRVTSSCSTVANSFPLGVGWGERYDQEQIIMLNSGQLNVISGGGGEDSVCHLISLPDSHELLFLSLYLSAGYNKGGGVSLKGPTVGGATGGTPLQPLVGCL